MKTQYLLIPLILSVVLPNFLSAQKSKTDKDSIKLVIMETEQQFCFDLNKYDVQYAFGKYADENAVINRGKDSLIFGKKEIENYYSKPVYKNATAHWKPDFIEVSDDGTLAYTYGKYEWKIIDDKNKVRTFKGIFHTVWKKNKDGNWYYVWD